LHVKNGGGLFEQVKKALTNWSNQLDSSSSVFVVCVCVCVVEATNVSFACLLACLLAFNGWGKSWSVVLCLAQPHSINLSFPPLSPTHTPNTQNKWKNDKTLKKKFLFNRPVDFPRCNTKIIKPVLKL
jgi:hypothetical protein